LTGGFILSVYMGHTKQIALEHHSGVVYIFKIPGLSYAAWAYGFVYAALFKHLGHKLRTEIMVFPLPDRKAHYSQHHSQGGKSKLITLFLKVMKIRAEFTVFLIGYRYLIEHTAHRDIALSVVMLYLFDNESLENKAVKGVHILFKSDRRMGIGVMREKSYGLCAPPGRLREQNINFFHISRLSSALILR